MLLLHLPATKELILLIDIHQTKVKNKKTMQQLDLLPLPGELTYSYSKPSAFSQLLSMV
jgi:hypothetical protein